MPPRGGGGRAAGQGGAGPGGGGGDRRGRVGGGGRPRARRRNVVLVGSTHEVLVEGRAKRGELLQGRTRTNKVALIPGPDAWIGGNRDVRSTGTTGSTFTAVAPRGVVLGHADVGGRTCRSEEDSRR